MNEIAIQHLSASSLSVGTGKRIACTLCSLLTGRLRRAVAACLDFYLAPERRHLWGFFSRITAHLSEIDEVEELLICSAERTYSVQVGIQAQRFGRLGHSLRRICRSLHLAHYWLCEHA